MRRITMECGQFFNVAHEEDKFRLSRFLFEDLDIKAQNSEVHPEYIDSLTISNVKINDKEFFLPIKQ